MSGVPRQETSADVEKAECPFCERWAALNRDLDGFGRPTTIKRYTPHAGNSFGRLCERSGEICERSATA